MADAEWLTDISLDVSRPGDLADKARRRHKDSQHAAGGLYANSRIQHANITKIA